MLPDILEGLHAAVRAELGDGSGVSVDFGPQAQDLDALDAIGVGVDAVAEEIAPAVGQTLGMLGSTRETWQVTSVAQSMNGDGDLLRATRRVWELVQVMHRAAARLSEDVPAVYLAEVISHGYRPVRDDNGAGALVEVTTRVETYEQETQ